MSNVRNRKWVAASIQGRSHRKDGKPNQDALRFVSDETLGVHVAVVADGAGSALYANVGARTCVDFLAERFLQIGCDLACGQLEPRRIEPRVQEAIEEHLQTLGAGGRQLSDYHHTLSAVIVTPKANCLFQVGDSPAVVIPHSADLKGLTKEKLPHLFEGHEVHNEIKEGYPNETHFVTEVDWRRYFRFTRMPADFGAVFLMTDGAEAAFLAKGQVYRPSMFGALSKIIEEPVRGSEFLAAWLSHPDLDGVSDDDKSMVGLLSASWFEPADPATENSGGIVVAWEPPPVQAPSSPAVQAALALPSPASQRKPAPSESSVERSEVGRGRALPPAVPVASSPGKPAGSRSWWQSALLGAGLALLGGAAALTYVRFAPHQEAEKVAEKPANSNEKPKGGGGTQIMHIQC